MGIQGIYSDPRVRLKLDPGEFGFSYGTSLARTPAAISGQEFGNLIGFRREALAKGLDVDFAQISLTPGLSSSGPTVQSGKTEVRFADKPGIPQALNSAAKQQNSKPQATTPFTNPLLSALDVARQFVEQFHFSGAKASTAESANAKTTPLIQQFKNADNLANVQAFREFLKDRPDEPFSSQDIDAARGLSFLDTMSNFLTQFPLPSVSSGFFVNNLA
jgi:hypothetical protein